MRAIQPRLYYIDWIRIIAFSLLILLHGMVPFTAIPWEINNGERSELLTRIVFWLHQWRLPLLFFVSGLGINLSMKSRTLASFYGERFRRLFVPLLFAMFFLIPIQPYFEFLQKGKISAGYWQFYQQVWELKVYPDGPLTWSHMWFVVYLIAFILVLFPFFLLGKQKWVMEKRKQVEHLLGNPLLFVLAAVPIIGIIYQLSLEYPENGSLTEDWFAFTLFITMLVYGYLVGASHAFWNQAATYKWITGGIALISGLILFSFYWKPMPSFTVKDNRFTMYCVFNGIHIWSMILFWCGMAKHYLDKPSPILRYLNEAVYPYFIIHQTIIVAIGYYIVQWQMPLIIKCILLISLSVLMIIATYHLVIRKTKLTRFLFGMK
jgi:glucans biosynthesis protein C